MRTKEQVLFLEEGEIIDDLSLDSILGGVNDKFQQEGDCDYCNTCGSSNNSHNGNKSQLISMG